MEKGKLTASTKRYRNSGWAGKHLPRKSKKAPTPTPAMVVAVERSSAWMEQKEPKRDFGKIIISIGRKMYEGGYVTANDGNITMRVGDDEVWATPTGVSKGDLSDDKLLRVRISTGEILEGTWNPTTELLTMPSALA